MLYAVKRDDGSVVMEFRTDGSAPSSDYVANPPIPSGHEVVDIVDGAVVTQEIDTLALERAAMVVTPRQIRLALSAAGLLSAVNAHVALDETASVTWEYALQIERNSPVISALAATFTDPDTGLTITAEKIDDLFRAAALIE